MNRDDFRAIAHRMIGAGYPVIPLHGIRSENGIPSCSCKNGASCNAPGKKPCIKWVKDGPLLTPEDVDKFLVENWECTGDSGTYRAEVPEKLNIGVPAGRGFVVIDVDVKNGGDGERQLKELEDQHGVEVPKSAAVRTGSGGYHYYLRIPHGLTIRSTRLAKDVELKAEGSYIVVPPSNHISGGTYGGACPLIDGNIPEAPAWVIEVGSEVRSRSVAQDPAAEFPPAEAQMVYEGCELLRYAREHPNAVRYDLWLGALSIFARCENGDNVCVDFSRGYSAFNAGEVAEKSEEARRNMSPRTCEWFRSAILSDDEDTPCSRFCNACDFGRRTNFSSSPVTLGVDSSRAAINSAVKIIDTAILEARNARELSRLVREDVISALVRLKPLSYQRFSEFELQLATTKIGGQSVGKSRVSKLINEAERGQNQGDARQSAPSSTIGDSVTDAPVADLRMPDGYHLTDAGLERLVRGDGGGAIWVPVSNIPIILTGLFYSPDEPDLQYAQISYRASNRWRSKLVPLSYLSKARDITEIGDADLIVSDQNARHLVAWFHHLRSANQDRIPTARLSRVLGWTKDDSSFLLGDRVVTPRGVAPNEAGHALSNGQTIFYSPHAGENQIADMCRQKGDHHEWASSMASIADFPVVRLVILASFSSVLFKIIDEPPFLADLTWTTSAGKTIALELASSVWFDPALAQQNWDSTFVGAEKRMSVMGSVPLIIDDTATVSRNKFGQDLLRQIVYKVGGGGSRTRGESRGGSVGLRGFSQARTVIITSGEQPATTYIGGGGSNTRILPVSAQPFGRQDCEMGRFVDGLRTVVRSNFGHGGERFVQYVMANLDQRTSWRREVTERAAEIARTHSSRGSVQRVAKYLAILELTARLVAEAFPEFNWKPSLDLDGDGRGIISAILDTAEDPLQCQKALQMVVSRATSQRDHFYPVRDQGNPPLSYFGEFELDLDGNINAIKFYPHVLKGEDGWLKRDNFTDSEAILREWASRGWIETQIERRGDTEVVRNARKVRIGGGDPQWSIVINRHGLQAAGVELVPRQPKIVGLKGEAA